MNQNNNVIAIEWLNSRILFGMKLGLENIQALLNRFDNPHHKQNYIHVVGSNGKGSTIALIDFVLRRKGLKTARYHSPHLISFCERIRVNDELISLDELSEILIQIKEVSEELPSLSPTFFEVLTVAAFVYFNKKKPDVILVEAGLGGRLDSTNVIESKIGVLTSISLEHANILGYSKEEILLEKLGILKANQNMVYQVSSDLEELALKTIQAKGATPSKVKAECFYFENFDPSFFDGRGLFFKENLKTAFEVLLQFGIDKNEIIREFKELPISIWPGRFQKLSQKDLPDLLIDGAHNTDAIKYLVESVLKDWGSGINLVLGVSLERDAKEWLPFLEKFTGNIFIPKCEHLKLHKSETLKEIFPQAQIFESVESCYEKIKEFKSEKFLITGSLYFLSEWVLQLRKDYSDLAYFKNLIPEFNERAK